MKRLIALLSIMIMAMVFPVSASAAVTQYSNTTCSGIWNLLNAPVPFVCFAEDANYGGDKLIFTGSSDFANLGTLTHSPSGRCAPKQTWDTDNWNDCISSVWGKMSSADSVCMYHNANYDFVFKRWFVSSSAGVTTFFDNDLGPTQSDVTSSIMVQQSGPACNEGGV